MSVGLLGDLQVVKRPANFLARAGRQQAFGRLDQVPRPGQMIAPQIIITFI